jgi:histidinol-phosphate aminotransferase
LEWGEGSSLAEWVAEWPNLVVMQTLSKAFGLAGIRLGAAFTSPPIASLLNNLKAPYNISSPTSAIACQALQGGLNVMQENREKIITQRARLIKELPKVNGIGRFRGVTALKVYEKLAENKGVVVRFRGKEHGCLGCLRITVGTEDEVTRFFKEAEAVIKEVHGEGGTVNGIVEEEKEKAANSVVS